MTTSSAAENLTPFDLIGGEECVARFVNRFYDLMDSDPAYAGLRSLHAADLGPMRASLTDFLIAWLVTHIGGGLTELRIVSALLAVASIPVCALLSAHQSIGVPQPL